MRLVLAAATAASVAVMALPAHAASLDVPSGTYVSDPTHTSVTWKVSHLGLSFYTGSFDRGGIKATVELDADDVAKSTLSATISGTEVVTLHPVALDPRNVDFDSKVASDEFLNAGTFPEITFTSTGIEVTGDNTANITGELTLNDQTHPVVLDATLNAAVEHPMSGTPVLGVSAVGTIDRTLFGVNALAGPIGTMVSVEIEAEFLAQQ
ncbi:MAG: YceI family protein [Pseudomonadota bacterium]